MSQSSEQWDARYRESESVWSLEPNQFVVEYLSDVPPGKMLDLAGGEGRNALWFAQRGWSVENYDLSPVAIQKFLERAERDGLHDRCTGTVGSALDDTMCVTAPVDLVVIAYLQLDPADLASSIATAARSLGPNGMLFGVWHERGNVGRGVGGPQKPELNPTTDELITSAEQAGLVVRNCEIRERRVIRDGAEAIAVDVVLLASR